MRVTSNRALIDPVQEKADRFIGGYEDASIFLKFHQNQKADASQKPCVFLSKDPD
jgi:hypothetical protein